MTNLRKLLLVLTILLMPVISYAKDSTKPSFEEILTQLTVIDSEMDYFARTGLELDNTKVRFSDMFSAKMAIINELTIEEVKAFSVYIQDLSRKKDSSALRLQATTVLSLHNQLMWSIKFPDDSN
jgi:hypothetical protein